MGFVRCVRYKRQIKRNDRVSAVAHSAVACRALCVPKTKSGWNRRRRGKERSTEKKRAKREKSKPFSAFSGSFPLKHLAVSGWRTRSRNKSNLAQSIVTMTAHHETRSVSVLGSAPGLCQIGPDCFSPICDLLDAHSLSHLWFTGDSGLIQLLRKSVTRFELSYSRCARASFPKLIQGFTNLKHLSLATTAPLQVIDNLDISNIPKSIRSIEFAFHKDASLFAEASSPSNQTSSAEDRLKLIDLNAYLPNLRHLTCHGSRVGETEPELIILSSRLPSALETLVLRRGCSITVEELSKIPSSLTTLDVFVIKGEGNEKDENNEKEVKSKDDFIENKDENNKMEAKVSHEKASKNSAIFPSTLRDLRLECVPQIYPFATFPVHLTSLKAIHGLDSSWPLEFWESLPRDLMSLHLRFSGPSRLLFYADMVRSLPESLTWLELYATRGSNGVDDSLVPLLPRNLKFCQIPFGNCSWASLARLPPHLHTLPCRFDRCPPEHWKSLPRQLKTLNLASQRSLFDAAKLQDLPSSITALNWGANDITLLQHAPLTHLIELTVTKAIERMEEVETLNLMKNTLRVIHTRPSAINLSQFDESSSLELQSLRLWESNIDANAQEDRKMSWNEAKWCRALQSLLVASSSLYRYFNSPLPSHLLDLELISLDTQKPIENKVFEILPPNLTRLELNSIDRLQREHMERLPNTLRCLRITAERHSEEDMDETTLSDLLPVWIEQVTLPYSKAYTHNTVRAMFQSRPHLESLNIGITGGAHSFHSVPPHIECSKM